MLTKEQLHGLWVGIPTEWDAQGELDERAFRNQVAMLIDTHPHGLYTTGSSGEYYAMDWEEYTRMVDAFAAETVGKVPMQVGANWFNTRDTIKRVRYARDKGIQGAQVCFPFWMEMRTEDYDQFFADIYEAVPDISLVHYNIYRSKRVFHGEDYIRIQQRVPSLIGTKAGMSLSDIMYLTTQAPHLQHFVGESTLAAGMLLGAKGAYTTYYLINPTLMHHYYDLLVAGHYNEAMLIARKMACWEMEAIVPLVQKGYYDPTIDKAFTELGGWLPGNRRTRAPHAPLSDAEMAWFRGKTEELFPELMGYRP